MTQIKMVVCVLAVPDKCSGVLMQCLKLKMLNGEVKDLFYENA